ncbi:MAG TPA: hypothetical protein VJV04_05150, partial [Nitrospiraceae bacterium]|nr:hypothetical protein [Nitrospiraceae bacterium]
MKERLPLFDKDDRENEKNAPARKHVPKTERKRAATSKNIDGPAMILKPVTAEFAPVTLRQRVLPRYIFEQL